MTKVNRRCDVCGHSRAADRRLVSSFHAYICEHCIAEASVRVSRSDLRDMCAFCALPNVVIAAVWSNFQICHECLALAHRVIADDNRLIAQAT
jgi:hypothetical protein